MSISLTVLLPVGQRKPLFSDAVDGLLPQESTRQFGCYTALARSALEVNVSAQDLNDGPSQGSTGVLRGTRGQGIVTLLSQFDDPCEDDLSLGEFFLIIRHLGRGRKVRGMRDVPLQAKATLPMSGL